jgi:uncharacterized membrane protein
MMIYWFAFFLGVVAGLRTFMAPAAVSLAARFGLLHLKGTWLAFLGYVWTPWIFLVLAIGELFTDQLPSTPSRTVPTQFAARLVSGGLAGAALCGPSGRWLAGMIAGLAGAIIGTQGGHAARAGLARALGRDRPAALVEDVVAIAGAVLILAVAT